MSKKPKISARSIPAELSASLVSQGVEPWLADILAGRGVTTLEEAFPTMASVPSPFGLKGMEASSARIARAIVAKEKLCVVGDYDCDGATATSVMVLGLKAMGAKIEFVVPDRMVQGYGLTESIVDMVLDKNYDILITVDNGISSVAGVAHAHKHGLEVIVTDHHLCPDVLPDTPYIVNPQQKGCTYPSKSIAGCGVAWNFVCAVKEQLIKLGKKPTLDTNGLLPLVAIGTVADLVALDVVNRALVIEGLNLIRRGEGPEGVKAICGEAGIDMENMTTTDIGYKVAPRINAVGRIADMSLGIRCLTTTSLVEASKLAQKLSEVNQARKELQEKMKNDAATAMDEQFEEGKLSICVHNSNWHEGVVGIVAGRMKEDWYRPVFVFTDAHDGTHKASGRSIEGFHLKHALDEIAIRKPGLVLRYGGHAAAAGVVVAQGKLDEFADEFEKIASRHITEDMRERHIEIDGLLPLTMANPKHVLALNKMVWGQGFPAPVFAESMKVISIKKIGSANDSLKMKLKSKKETIMDAIKFSHVGDVPTVGSSVKVIVKPEINRYNGTELVQLNVAYMVPGEERLVNHKLAA